MIRLKRNIPSLVFCLGFMLSCFAATTKSAHALQYQTVCGNVITGGWFADHYLNDPSCGGGTLGFNTIYEVEYAHLGNL